MSTINQADTHHLLFVDYKFPLEDKPFLDRYAHIHFEGVAKSKRVSESIRETLRVMAAFPGLKLQYAVHASPVDDKHAWSQVHEYITMIGQEDLPFATIHLKNGPRTKVFGRTGDGGEALPVLKLIESFEKKLVEAKASEWWVGEEGQSFQVQTLEYEWRKILLDLPGEFHGMSYNDGHGKTHLYFTQVGDKDGKLEFEDERIEVTLTVIHPAVFNAAVIEKREQALTTA